MEINLKKINQVNMFRIAKEINLIYTDLKVNPTLFLQNQCVKKEEYSEEYSLSILQKYQKKLSKTHKVEEMWESWKKPRRKGLVRCL